MNTATHGWTGGYELAYAYCQECGWFETFNTLDGAGRVYERHVAFTHTAPACANCTIRAAAR